MKISARTTYLLIACIIALLFTGTGAYYVLDLQNKKSQEKEPETYIADPTLNNTKSATPTPKPTETPKPTSTPKPTTTPKPQIDIESNKVDTDTQNSEILLADQIEDTLNSSCYKTCEYSYECSGDYLQCLSINGIKKCVNPECKSNTNCNCKIGSVGMENTQQKNTTIAAESEEDTNEEEFGESLGGINDEVVETETAVTQEVYEADLPKAGSQEFTLAILAIGIAITAIGVVWNKSEI